MSENRPSIAETYVPQFELRPVDDRPVATTTMRPVVINPGPVQTGSAQYAVGSAEDCILCNSKARRSESETETGSEVHRSYRNGDRVDTFLIIFLLIELLLGIACLTVEAHYEVNTLFTRYYSYHYLERNTRQYLVSARLLYGTTTAMPVFVFAMLITIWISRQRANFSVLTILIALVGFVVYTATGIVGLTFPKHDNWVPNGAKLMFEILAIATGLFYLIHLIYEMLKK